MAMEGGASVAAYDRAGAPGGALFIVHHLLARSVSALAPRGGTVLDVGCGSGGLLLQLARGRPDLTIIGCDLSAPMLAAGRRAIAAAGVTNLKLEQRDMIAAARMVAPPFDVLTCHSALHHLPGRRELRRALTAFADARRRLACAVFVSDLARPPSQAVLDWLDESASSYPAPLREDLRASLRAAWSYRELAQAIDAAGGGRWRRGRVPNPGEVQWYWAPRAGRGHHRSFRAFLGRRDARALRAAERELFMRLPHVVLGR
jgi:ubiquinone/menaquinone biosynthesis C-methylase UbiE